MNKTGLIKRLSELSDVDVDDCERVIDAFRKVLEEEFESKDGLSETLNKLCKLIINVFNIKIRIV